MKFDIKEELQKLPSAPGVYIMKDKSDEVIYVGKAISLKNRVRQYFQISNQQANAKVGAMVERIVEFEYIITDTEVEALILESNLIKKHKPKYNILLRDDKQYPYIKVTLKEIYPRVMKTRNVIKDGAKYYGPYPSGIAVKEILEIIHSTYPIRTCNLNLKGNKMLSRPCLNYYINRCLGPCQGNIEFKQYTEMIKEIKLFLNGKQDVLIEKLKYDMLEFSKKLDFEKAAEYRDKIKAIQTIHEEQKIIQTDGKNQDIIGIAKGRTDACIQIFFIRNGKIIGREHFIFSNIENENKSEIIGAFIKQFYSGEAYIPTEIYSEEIFEDLETTEIWLSQKKGQNVHIKIPQKGIKNNLIKMVHLNALEILNKHVERHKSKRNNFESNINLLQLKLEMKIELKRIEAYDISNTQGTHSVGGMVVFENGIKNQSEYRRFKIKSIEGPNDYGSMKELIYRRFKNYIDKTNNFSKLPDLIMVDGGKGQVNVALSVLKELDLNISVCGLVKDDKHRTRGIIYNGREINLSSNSLELKFITRIQDEVHRFAINYHRSLRDKNMVKSELDEIEGIGPKRKSALFKEFESISKIKEQSIESLAEIEGMTKKSASSVYYYFRK